MIFWRIIDNKLHAIKDTDNLGFEESEGLRIPDEYLKEKISKLQAEVKKKSDLEDSFNQEIDELSKETENLVTEIEKWQM